MKFTAANNFGIAEVPCPSCQDRRPCEEPDFCPGWKGDS